MAAEVPSQIRPVDRLARPAGFGAVLAHLWLGDVAAGYGTGSGMSLGTSAGRQDPRGRSGMFSDEVVIVTGAGGSLGAAVVEILAGRGARLAAMDRTHAALDRVMAGVTEPEPHFALAGVDLTDSAACLDLVDQVLQRFGRVEGLVNTVGTFAMAGIDAADPAQWDFLFKVNLTTTLNMCRAAVPPMRAAGRGSIVNVGAGAALKAPGGMSAYAASKSAVLRLTESLADELKSHGARANCVLPSAIDTPQNRAAMPKADVGRWVAPTQVVEAVAFLVADAGSGVNGAAIPVSGRG
jgi:NAD(P)-dependent dehydrogenase (short-subunit alcohol dehydrogenase family)